MSITQRVWSAVAATATSLFVLIITVFGLDLVFSRYSTALIIFSMMIIILTPVFLLVPYAVYLFPQPLTKGGAITQAIVFWLMGGFSLLGILAYHFSTIERQYEDPSTLVGVLYTSTIVLMLSLISARWWRLATGHPVRSVEWPGGRTFTIRAHKEDPVEDPADRTAE